MGAMNKDNVVVSKRSNGRLRVQSKVVGPSLAQQQFKDQCDVNNIMARYKKTGSITHVRNRSEGVYADLAEMPDYHDALNIVIRAGKAFADMPAAIRNRFGNDPAQLMAFLKDSNNREEAIKLGLIEKEGLAPAVDDVEAVAVVKKKPKAPVPAPAPVEVEE